MNKMLIGLLSLAFAAGTAFAADDKAAEAKKPTPQQERMKSCNKEAGAKSLKGDERKQFMKGCLSGKPAEAAAPAAQAGEAKPATQQDKMKACNKEAGDKALKGADRKKFMSGCLKGEAAAK